ncbi:MAG: DUF4861 family protein [Bacteroidetes bacterium]|nr:DUF4861 family protein [Fibrella sp.]
MRTCLLTVLLLGLITLASGQSARLQITNPGPTARPATLVEIPWTLVKAAYPLVDTAQLQVVLLPGNKPVRYQFEHLGAGVIQNLLVQVDLPAGQPIQLVLRRGEPDAVKALTYCRYVPQRFDDFAWENDRIAFRIYGAALEGRSDNAYGMDIWAKRTSELILDKWYASGDYHADNGEGLDYYKVGYTLGAGDVGVLLGDTIGYIHNYKTWEILDNGPLRSTFRVSYPAARFGGTTVSTVKTISLDAGAQLSRVRVKMTHDHPQPLPVVVGITLRPEDSPLLLDAKSGVLGYYEPPHGKDGTLGIGSVFPNGVRIMRRHQQHGLAEISLKSGEVLTYYNGGAWDKAGVVTNAEAWFAHLRQQADQLKQPPTVTIVSAAANR